MTDRDEVYTKVKKTIKQMMKPDHQEQIVTLAMMMSGMAMVRNATFCQGSIRRLNNGQFDHL